MNVEENRMWKEIVANGLCKLNGLPRIRSATDNLIKEIWIGGQKMRE